MPLFKTTRSQTVFWFSLSLVLAAIGCLLILKQSFSGEYVVQDDVRQHVFWMQRFIDPQLFPNDLIADYFQSLAPWGYRQLYQGFAAMGVNPLVLSKLLPVPLTLLTAAYAFGIGMQLLPLPFAGFVASVLTSQVLWMHDDVVSATPRAFLPPLFLAFWYYLLQRDTKPVFWRSLLPCLVAIVLEGLFYPQYVLVFAGIAVLQLVKWQPGKLRLTQDRQDYLFCGACLGVAALVLLPVALSASPYGPVISGAEARQLTEFLSIGRNRFFWKDPLRFWLVADRSSLFPAFRPWFLAIGIFLPVLLHFGKRYPAQLPLIQQVSRKTVVLLQVVIVALFLFFAAHLLLFKLYLPSRYTEYTLRFTLVFATAIVLVVLLHAAWHWLHQQTPPKRYQQFLVWTLTLTVAAGLLLYPSVDGQAIKSYWVGEHPKLYQFFARQPKDIRIASVARDVDNIPTFAQRSLWVGREYALPYQVGYANQFRQRVIDTLQAQYSLEPSVLA
ncbi:MAG TPA: hypothetical protein V6C57_00085, partial [Coleofasciculaceae cyanobacterium]